MAWPMLIAAGMQLLNNQQQAKNAAEAEQTQFDQQVKGRQEQTRAYFMASAMEMAESIGNPSMNRQAVKTG